MTNRPLRHGILTNSGDEPSATAWHPDDIFREGSNDGSEWPMRRSY